MVEGFQSSIGMEGQTGVDESGLDPPHCHQSDHLELKQETVEIPI